MNEQETPEDQLNRIKTSLTRAGGVFQSSDVQFLIDQHAQALQDAKTVLAGTLPGRLFGLREAANVIERSGRRMKLSQGREAIVMAVLMCRAAEGLRAYAAELEVQQDRESARAA